MTSVMTEQPEAKKERGPRERIVFSAAQLIRQRGVSGTGLRDVVAHAHAPWGSLQHYFPGGKDQIVAEALGWSGRFAARRVDRYLSALDPATPSGLFAAMADQWRAQFRSEGFAAGCPLVAAAADVAAESVALRQAVTSAFDQWQQPVAAALAQLGIPADRAASLATLMISSLEGAIVLARVRQDVVPLDIVVTELGPLLDQAVAARGDRGLERARPDLVRHLDDPGRR
jgi:AcrR family transcriptional regulator